MAASNRLMMQRLRYYITCLVIPLLRLRIARIYFYDKTSSWLLSISCNAAQLRIRNSAGYVRVMTSCTTSTTHIKLLIISSLVKYTVKIIKYRRNTFVSVNYKSIKTTNTQDNSSKTSNTTNQIWYNI